MKTKATAILFLLFLAGFVVVPFCAWRAVERDLDVFYCISDAGEVCVCDSQAQELRIDCPSSDLMTFHRRARK